MLTELFVKYVHLLKTSGKRWLATQTGLLSTTLLVRVAEWSAGALLPLRKALAAIYFPPPPTPPPTPPAPPSTSMSPPAAADVPLPQHAAVAHTHSAPSQRRRVVRSLICSDPTEPETLAADGARAGATMSRVTAGAGPKPTCKPQETLRLNTTSTVTSR